MALETLTPSAGTRESLQKLAEKIDHRAIGQLAERGERIALARDESRKLATQVITGTADPDLGKEIAAEVRGGDMPGMVKPEEAVTPDQEGDLIQMTDKLADDRMNLIGNDREMRTDKLEADVGGVFDGDNAYIAESVLINGTDQAKRNTGLHEAQHRADGLLGDRNIDEPLAKKTGIAAIDQRLNDTITGRNLLELRAMRAEESGPSGPYLQEHWNPSMEVKRQLDAAGLDFEANLDAMVKKNDIEGMQTAIRKAAMHEAGIDSDPENN